MMELDGETLCLSAWARRVGMSGKTLEMRLKKGMSLKDAISIRQAKAVACRGIAAAADIE